MKNFSKAVIINMRFIIAILAFCCVIQMACDNRQIYIKQQQAVLYDSPTPVLFGDQQQYSGYLLSVNQLESILKTTFPNAHIETSDSKYLTITKSELVYDYISTFIMDLGMKYSDKFDCDDFSVAFKMYTQLKHARNDYPGQSRALGVIHYVVDSREGAHAINVFIDIVLDETDGKYKAEVYFLEPQQDNAILAFRRLTPREIQSAYYIKF